MGRQARHQGILITGRILRRKGHHVVVKAVQRLKEMGLKDFLCVFVGEDRGRTRYTGELWDLVLYDRHNGRDPHGCAGCRHAGGLRRRISHRVGGDPAGRRATRNPGSARRWHGQSSCQILALEPTSCSPHRRSPKAGSQDFASMPETMRRWRQPCFGCSQCRNRTAQLSADAVASGCSGISMPAIVTEQTLRLYREIAGLSMRPDARAK